MSIAPIIILTIAQHLNNNKLCDWRIIFSIVLYAYKVVHKYLKEHVFKKYN